MVDGYGKEKNGVRDIIKSVDKIRILRVEYIKV